MGGIPGDIACPMTGYGGEQKVDMEEFMAVHLFDASRRPAIASCVDAVRRQNGKLLRDVLQELGHLEAHKEEVASALYYAATSNYVKGVHILLKRGVSPVWTDTLEGHGDLPLVAAAGKGYTDIIKLLLKYGALVNAQNVYLLTALHKAVLHSQIECVKLLLAHGASCSLQDIQGDTPVAMAVNKNKADILSLLLKHDCDVNIVDRNTLTPLHTAVRNKRPDIVQMLLTANADLHLTDYCNRTPIQFAAQFGYVDILKLLIKHLPISRLREHFLSPALIDAVVWHEDAACTRLLCEAGANPNTQSRTGHTVLALAAGAGHTAVAACLLQSGADPNMPCTHGSALHQAAFHQQVECVRLLLSYNADPNIQMAKTGWTPLFSLYVLNSESTKEEVDIWKLLLRANTNLELRGCDRITPSTQNRKYTHLEVAVKTRCRLSVEMLMIAGADRRPLQRWFTQNRIPVTLLQDPDLLEWVRQVCFQPLSLKQICRNRLRPLLSRSNSRQCLDKLWLPRSLTEYLDLQDLNGLSFGNE